MKLIDVLLMISKGELKEGTKIKLLYDETDEVCILENVEPTDWEINVNKEYKFIL